MSGEAELYVSHLTEEGYQPTVDADGDVVFKHEGLTYYIDIDTNDESFFRLVCPNFWSIDSPEELLRALLAANYVTRKMKVAKVYVHNDGKDVSASIEIFLAQPEHFKAVFRRSLSALQSSISNFRSRMVGGGSL
ncbi:MAG: hypothetical protein RMM31_05300 [Anaerolineae bacterium]|nr:YbjN domain-containing protein [Thermoflexales bacterium]MDW8395644.1 hypothetical protein [Anaerolineae bacterium]